jgi:hypothetical protein
MLIHIGEIVPTIIEIAVIQCLIQIIADTLPEQKTHTGFLGTIDLTGDKRERLAAAS